MLMAVVFTMLNDMSMSCINERLLSAGGCATVRFLCFVTVSRSMTQLLFSEGLSYDPSSQ